MTFTLKHVRNSNPILVGFIAISVLSGISFFVSLFYRIHQDNVEFQNISIGSSVNAVEMKWGAPDLVLHGKYEIHGIEYDDGYERYKSGYEEFGPIGDGVEFRAYHATFPSLDLYSFLVDENGVIVAKHAYR